MREQNGLDSSEDHSFVCIIKDLPPMECPEELKEAIGFFEGLQSVQIHEKGTRATLSFQSGEKLLEFITQNIQNPLKVKNQRVCIEFSTDSNRLEKARNKNAPNKVVLCQICPKNSRSMTVDEVLEQFEAYGKIEKVVLLYKQTRTQAFVQMDSLESASNLINKVAKHQFKNFYVQSAQFSHKKELHVDSNTQFEYDFQLPKGKSPRSPSKMNHFLHEANQKHVHYHIGSPFGVFEGSEGYGEIVPEQVISAVVKELQKNMEQCSSVNSSQECFRHCERNIELDILPSNKSLAEMSEGRERRGKGNERKLEEPGGGDLSEEEAVYPFFSGSEFLKNKSHSKNAKGFELYRQAQGEQELFANQGEYNPYTMGWGSSQSSIGNQPLPASQITFGCIPSNHFPYSISNQELIGSNEEEFGLIQETMSMDYDLSQSQNGMMPISRGDMSHYVPGNEAIWQNSGMPIPPPGVSQATRLHPFDAGSSTKPSPSAGLLGLFFANNPGSTIEEQKEELAFFPNLTFHNIPGRTITLEMLFNLCSVYGNIQSIGFIDPSLTKAVVNYQDQYQAMIAELNLNNCPIFGSIVTVSKSTPAEIAIQSSYSSHSSLYRDFSLYKEQRFKIPGSKNFKNLSSPCQDLHISNLNPNYGCSYFQNLFQKVAYPIRVAFFIKNPSMGVVSCTSVDQAVRILMTFHNSSVET